MSIRGEKGFTLIEIVIALAVSMVILSSIYMTVNSTQHHSSSIERRIVAQQDVKPALDIMAMELSMASYNPTFNETDLWVTVDYATCTASKIIQKDDPLSYSYRGIREATSDSIQVQMDTTGSGSDGNGILDDSSEVVSYRYITASQLITRVTYNPSGTVCPDVQPFLGSTVTGQKTVRVINDTLGIPVFRYFDGQGNEIAESGTNLGGQIPNIRRIAIVLAVETEHIDVITGQRKRLIYSTNVIPRNHAIRFQ